ncbi:MAG: aminoglycoside phosphotransferase family protein [Clostridiales bacterium]|nr:aminoglycoside phosphotransferase family protein [Clostridiales bacterium]
MNASFDCQLPLNGFAFEGEILSCERYGNGHINETYLVVTTAARYILQKINTNIFKNVDGLMHNIEGVLAHQRKNTSDPRSCMTLIYTKDGKNCLKDDTGVYRAYLFVEGSLCLNRAETPADFAESGAGFGAFQRMLRDFPAETLFETIPNFHNTPDRYRIFKEAIALDPIGRKKEVEREIDFALAREKDAAALLSAGLPLRVTHNDTKLNNVLLDAATRKALCVIDLDTVMPGYAAYDFGDSIRFGASTGAEDEKDLDKIEMSLSLFETYSRAFLAESALTKPEIELMPMGAKLMTLECGVRFLTDYIMGDTYFRIHRPEHNLDRTRTQFKLVHDMEKKWAEMARLVKQ